MSDLQHDHGGPVQLLEEAKPQLKKPTMYQVILLNDDFTPMDFVVKVLEHFFGLGQERATQIMFQIHNSGKGICGVYTYDVAETKVALVSDYARAHEYPLLCDMEAIDN
jgi:ATP-dependent Clp protease adaptor protein ClpS